MKLQTICQRSATWRNVICNVYVLWWLKYIDHRWWSKDALLRPTLKKLFAKAVTSLELINNIYSGNQNVSKAVLTGLLTPAQYAEAQQEVGLWKYGKSETGLFLVWILNSTII